MGSEINRHHFLKGDFEEFSRRLVYETNVLSQWLSSQHFDKRGKSLGFELESWLVDNRFQPTPENINLLKKNNLNWLAPELSRFNIEMNSPPYNLNKNILRRLHQNLKKSVSQIQQSASKMNCKLLMIGTLPTLKNSSLKMKVMSPLHRYHALNDQVMHLRKGKKINIHIRGHESLKIKQENVMLEAAGTSFQIHLHVEPQYYLRHFNASIVASAPMVALTANSPFLFGKNLWEETRIPLFEQAVSVPGFMEDHHFIRRVTFGSGYMNKSPCEYFEENLKRYPVLLPVLHDEAPEQLSHLLLHNSTIWRWNRPVVGFEKNGRPHFRIEHRVMAAGPTVMDMMANMAFYVGIVRYLATKKISPEKRLSFDSARNNFYRCARMGLAALITWVDGKSVNIRKLIQDKLIPQAREGLSQLKIRQSDIDYYLDVIVGRIQRGQTGAIWQRGFIKNHGPDFSKLSSVYFQHQEEGFPVHTWPL